MKNVCTLLLSLVFASTMGQEMIQDKISDYSDGPGVIVTGFGTPLEIGAIEADGSFSIPLKDDFKKYIQESLEAQNQSSSDWKTSLPTLERAFGDCNGNVVYQGGQQTMIEITTGGMFTVGNMEEQKLYGTMMFASSEEFADAFMAFGQFKSIPGYQLTWYYFDEEASVQGTCEMESYTQSMDQKYVQTTSYDLNFKTGWNIVKYEVHEIFTDDTGKKYEQKSSYATLGEIPDDVQPVLLKKSMY